VLKDRYVGIARAAIPVSSEIADARGYAALPHLLISPRGDARGIVDEPLEQLGATLTIRRPRLWTVDRVL